MAVPDTEHYRHALTIGDSRQLARRCCVHWIATGKDRWVRLQRERGWQILAVELADDAVALHRLAPAAVPTVVLLAMRPRASPPSTSMPPIPASRSRWSAVAPASTLPSPAVWFSTASPALSKPPDTFPNPTTTQDRHSASLSVRTIETPRRAANASAAPRNVRWSIPCGTNRRHMAFARWQPLRRDCSRRRTGFRSTATKREREWRPLEPVARPWWDAIALMVGARRHGGRGGVAPAKLLA